ncbi:MAG: exodeoxyribonuclease VII large subunit [Hyphomicrobiales bacterium]
MSNTENASRETNAAEFSVTEISAALKRTVEDTFGYVRVRGEISGYRGPHSSGHAYFSMKDDRARLEAVIWRGVFSKLKIKPEEGMEVIATGKLTTYPGSSKYQIVIDRIEPAGVGALMALLEERRKKLAAEGLFDEQRKKQLPFLPKVIGVVTSPTGAVIRDILHRLRDRFPTHVLVWPVRVQGETSGQEVANAVDGFNQLEGNRLPKPDLLIVARGGGSLEDLWGFNDEAVVRSVAASHIPVISAVGHETDWTLIDHVADHRAPTPTGAAERAVPVRHELESVVQALALRNAQAMRRNLEQQRSALRSLSRAMPSLDTLFGMPRQRFDTVAQRLSSALSANTAVHKTRLIALRSQMRPRILTARLERANDRKIQATQGLGKALAFIIERRRQDWRRIGALKPEVLSRQVIQGGTLLSERASRFDRAFSANTKQLRNSLDAQAQILNLVSYQSVLQRGFGLVRNDDGQPIRSASATHSGQAISLEFSDGKVDAVIGDAPPPTEKPLAKVVSAKKPATKKPKGTQGSLF